MHIIRVDESRGGLIKIMLISNNNNIRGDFTMNNQLGLIKITLISNLADFVDTTTNNHNNTNRLTHLLKEYYSQLDFAKRNRNRNM